MNKVIAVIIDGEDSDDSCINCEVLKATGCALVVFVIGANFGSRAKFLFTFLLRLGAISEGHADVLIYNQKLNYFMKNICQSAIFLD